MIKKDITTVFVMLMATQQGAMYACLCMVVLYYVLCRLQIFPFFFFFFARPFILITVVRSLLLPQSSLMSIMHRLCHCVKPLFFYLSRSLTLSATKVVVPVKLWSAHRSQWHGEMLNDPTFRIKEKSICVLSDLWSC